METGSYRQRACGSGGRATNMQLRHACVLAWQFIPRESYGQDWGSGPCLSLLLSGNTFYTSTMKRCLTFRAGPGDIVWREGGATTVLELLGHWLHGLRWQSRNKTREGDGMTGMAMALCSTAVRC